MSCRRTRRRTRRRSSWPPPRSRSRSFSPRPPVQHPSEPIELADEDEPAAATDPFTPAAQLAERNRYRELDRLAGDSAHPTCPASNYLDEIFTAEETHPVFINMEPSVDTATAAALLGISPATLRDWKCQRIGPPYIQLSARCVRYAVKDLEKFVADRRVIPSVISLGIPHAHLRKAA
jgi:hypothetical protein